MKTIPELNRIYHGDCVETMRNWPDNCVDAVVTDPPYGIRFMGKAWDGADIDRQARKREGQKPSKAKDGRMRPNPRQCRSEAAGTYDLAPESMRNFQMWTAAWAAEALRVLKPGGHLLAFASTRTYHRMACGVEDAGFEIRDKVEWLYGSGFPKSLDVSKAIDKRNGDKRPVVEKIIGPKPGDHGGSGKYGHGNDRSVTSAASAASAAWGGWGTALKPASEPVVVARKPLDGTVAANVLRWGTGALNIGAARIESKDDQLQEKYDSVQKAGTRTNSIYGADARDRAGATPHEGGRWPTNVLLDQYAAGMLDARAPGASRFFYVAKPDRGERNMGLDGEAELSGGTATDREDGTAGLRSPRAGAGRTGGIKNFHSTVKPVDVMAYLIQLITPRGVVVLDPFMGSGTTAIAAARLGHPYLGCEMSAEYVGLADKRIAKETAQGKMF